MQKELTELVFILDKSGSMSGLEDDTIGGFNAMLAKQQKEAGQAIITTVLFDDKYELLHDRLNINGVNPITDKEYCIGGSTALLDAVGKTIHKIGNAQKYTSEDQRAGKVVFEITTDGMENASHEYSYDKIKQMIEHQKARYDWEFIFLGANIDAVSTAAKFGIHADRAANYHADGLGMSLNYSVISSAVSELRVCQSLDKKWKEEIEADFKNRSKKDRK